MLTHMESTNYWLFRPQLMLIVVCHMPQFVIVLVYSYYWRLSDKNFKSSDLSSWIGEGLLALIQVWSFLQECLSVQTCTMRMGHVCDHRCQKYPSAFATVVVHTTLKLIRYLTRMTPLYNRV